MNNFDLVIVGAGMVGLALVARLKNSHLKIAVVDPKSVDMDFDRENYDLRISAITRNSENLFRSVDAWDFIGDSEKSAYSKMLVWDGESTNGKVEFDSAALAQENIGHIIENRVLRKALYQSIQNRPNIELMFGEKCQKVNYFEDKAELLLESGKKVSAKLLVAADGAFSWLRENSGIKLDESSYQQKAIVATIKTELVHNKTAYQRFDKHGPLAFLPFKDSNHCSIVWSQDNQVAEELLALDGQSFTKRLEITFEGKLGKLELLSQRLMFPLYERTAETTINHRLALIGDAAHTIHPLAGQGVNLGFSDANVLAETILSIAEKNKDIGLKVNLRTYQRKRASEIFIMKKSMFAFKELFGRESPIIQSLRAKGLQAVNNSQLIKSMIIKNALGLDKG